MRPTLLALALAATGPVTAAELAPAADLVPRDCDDCAAWNAPQEPFRLHGDSWYVGPAGLSVVAIDTGDGVILLDGALPESVPQIVDNLARIGLDLADVRWIVNSHAHFDHAGGIAALARLSGAKVAASPAGAAALRLGNVTPDDPQAGFGEWMRYAPVADVVELADGESITLGAVTLTAHHTPGHTPGGTSWTWRSCESDDCIDMVYADSVTPVSHDGYRFTDVPEATRTFARSLDAIAALPCDLLVTTHPGAAKLFERMQAGALVDDGACRAYAQAGRRQLAARIAREAAAR